ncbi:SAM-dependent methyltransferase [Pseudomonas sp. 21]|uniref:class I SAM-dependent methyltransferase n=1 Tax=unclassified Pseudomonas TaxID=196821 RepID=UPI0005EAF11B|nr:MULTISPECIES: class I SAM-dependent methyltransferase [unclassified Pseudomonas]KJJ97805.1 SAM-dependent methyltransferase [Pseudomonas sp. 21]MBV7585317.1 class I SAM-dependent methyltransferase [Pseudomonas sp. PDM33]
MNSPSSDLRNWFDQGGQAYARFRPQYPAELSAYLASVAPDRALAVDVGCGNGQLTRQLAEHFNEVVGFDPSADQIAHTVPQENLSYACAPAENLPLPSRSASLITAAQAAHWFDLPRFYAEVRRVAEPNAILALISYGVLRLDGALGERFEQFYWKEIGPYWPAERKLVDSGYATLDFPFGEFPGAEIAIRLEWNLEEFLGYVSTWSAVRSAREAGREDLLHDFASDLAGRWGDRAARHPVSWPINMRIGRV